MTTTNYNTFSLPTGVTFGSGDADSFTYDGNTGRMIAYLGALGALPWVTLAVTGPQSGSAYYDTDSFTLSVKGAANQPVTVLQNGTGPWPQGTTNGSGDWSVSKTWTSANVGTYTQIWYVGGVAASPTLHFNIVATSPQPAGPTSSALGPMSYGALTWNANGSLGQLAAMDGFNSGNAQTCNYTHDDLGRLSQVDCGTGKLGQSFTYGNDNFGNISWSVLSEHNGTGFQPTYSASTNRLTGLGTYDADGSLTWDGLHRYDWDADGNLSQLDSGTAMVYDALGRRVEQPNGTGTTEILYGPGGGKLALMSGQTVTKAFLPLPGGGTAVYSGSTLAWYRHPDWLGSSRIASTPGRTLYYDGAYSPQGEIISETGTADRNFTGQNQDLGGDLYDFPYREYRAGHGRWIRPDPAGLAAVNPANPQSWNRYAYANGSPMNMVDPLGLDSVQFKSENGCLFASYGSFEASWRTPEGGDSLSFTVIWGPWVELGCIQGTEQPVAAQLILQPMPTQLGGWGQAGPGGGGGGIGQGGPAGAPNNGTPWYKNSCVTSALGQGALSVGIDAIGLIPEAGGVARMIGHGAGYVGVVADRTGSRVIKAVGASTGTARGLSGLVDTSPQGLISDGLTVAGFIPGLGQAAAIGSIVNDAIKTGMAISKCP